MEGELKSCGVINFVWLKMYGGSRCSHVLVYFDTRRRLDHYRVESVHVWNGSNLRLLSVSNCDGNGE